jgi:hypothetical protein
MGTRKGDDPATAQRRARYEAVWRSLGCRNQSEFARRIGESTENVRNMIKRGSFSKRLVDKLVAQGIDVVWLRTGKGLAPAVAESAPGARPLNPAAIDRDLEALHADVRALTNALQGLASALSETTPGAISAFRHFLEAAPTDRHRSTVAAALRSYVQGLTDAAHSSSGGPPRTVRESRRRSSP